MDTYESDILDISGGGVGKKVLGVAVAIGVCLIIALMIYLATKDDSCADGKVKVGEKCLVECANGEVRVGEKCLVKCADGEVRVGVECKSKGGSDVDVVVPKTYTIDMCPVGYRDRTVKGSICTAGASVGFGEKEAKEVCDNAGHNWIPLDYMKNPYTCDIAA
jgi:hypothetical protein